MAAKVLTTRRLFLASAPVAAVMVGRRKASSDPIFAAIERHKAAEKAFADTINGQDEQHAAQHGREVTQADVDRHEAAEAEEQEAMEALLETVPLTPAGARAAVAYLTEIQDGYHLASFTPALLKSPALAA